MSSSSNRLLHAGSVRNLVVCRLNTNIQRMGIPQPQSAGQSRATKVAYVREGSCFIDEDVGIEAGGNWSTAKGLRPTKSFCIVQGFVSVRGLLKTENQDRIIAEEIQTVQSSNGDGIGGEEPRKQAVVCSAVFDGHGGVQAATFAQDNLRQIVQADSVLCDLLAVDSILEADAEQKLQQLLTNAFLRLDCEICDKSRECGLVDGAAAIAGFHAGPCLIVANAGDCRAVLCRSGQAIRLSCDHKPDLETERSRIEAEGGKVQHLKGAWRVLLPSDDKKSVKMLATSRGLGDLHFKESKFVSCEPEITHMPLVPHLDAFSIFASDGLWGFVDDQEAVDTVLEVIEEFAHMSQPLQDKMRSVADSAARKLIKLAVDSGSTDDVSVVVNMYEWHDSDPQDR